MSNKEYRIDANYQIPQSLLIKPTEVSGSLIVLIVNNDEDDDDRFGTIVTTKVSATYDATGVTNLSQMDVMDAREVWANTNDVDIHGYSWLPEDEAGVTKAIKKYLMEEITNS